VAADGPAGTAAAAPPETAGWEADP
jgi:hypothetical protein